MSLSVSSNRSEAPKAAVSFVTKAEEPKQDLTKISKVVEKHLGSKESPMGVALVKETLVATSKRPASWEMLWSLEDNWYMGGPFDGKYHKHGPMVFDEGTATIPEPGYYNSAKAACELAMSRDSIMQAPTPSLYMAISKIACRHFEGKANNTLMTAKESGQYFAGINKGCNGKVTDIYLSSPDFAEIEKEYTKHEALQYTDKKSEIWIKDFAEKANAKIAQINAHIEKRSKELGLSHPVAYVYAEPETCSKVSVKYVCTQSELQPVTEALFAEYRAKIAKAVTEDEKILCITDFYQMLEWIHPFRDGQGRTDLILQARELCRNGLNPAILDSPYVSSFTTLEEAAGYLKEGIRKWKEEERRQELRKVEAIIEKLTKSQIKMSGVYACDWNDQRVHFDSSSKVMQVKFSQLKREDFEKGYIEVDVQTGLDRTTRNPAFWKYENEVWQKQRIPIFSDKTLEEKIKISQIFAAQKL